MKDAIEKLSLGKELTETESYDSILSMMEDASEEDIAEFLTLLAKREPTVSELVGATRAMRDKMVAVPFEGEAIDTCGTGGSGFDTFNTSTISAFVLAASGVSVCKHGNRAASSRFGSADLLEALGYNLNLETSKIPELLKKTNFCFFFAPLHHPATKRVVGVRKKLGFRTIFNFLGPLSNPAGVKIQILGVSSEVMQKTIAEALLKLGTKRTLVVRGDEGLDEISLTSETRVFEIKDGEVLDYKIKPENFGLKRAKMEDISSVGDVDATISYTKKLLAGEIHDARRDLILLNVAAAFYILGRASLIKEGISLANQILDSGEALKKLEQIIEVSND